MATTAPSELEPKLLPAAPSESESLLSSLVYDTSQQFQMAMSNMLKMITEIDQTAGGIMEEIGKCKDTACERKKDLEEEKQRFQKAAYAVLGMLNDT
ncbi:POLYAMINE-MODULATED FACTOR 1-BINDING PROTEIN [Salix purpurea]|uniref:POLYAMINE-MODULATED FACTOR 1-BINDING PROTEIN n=1 Tax=Salix purpurea TaxID=77065 RepID=A0A9Q0T293_SALPP|nr:POLYAMINE-MODULATED FACTOR 1-BINDING PROTEIN [Salix purpurea]